MSSTAGTIAPDGRPGPPLWLLLELTDRGPLHCAYCSNPTEFARTGEVRGVSPSRRGLDTLRVEIRDEHDVWVYFENFKTGIAEKVSVA